MHEVEKEEGVDDMSSPVPSFSCWLGDCVRCVMVRSSSSASSTISIATEAGGEDAVVGTGKVAAVIAVAVEVLVFLAVRSPDMVLCCGLGEGTVWG